MPDIKRTEQKGDVGLVSCKPLLLKKRQGGSERESDFLKATELLNDRAGTRAQIRWPPAVMLSLRSTPLLSHVDRHGLLRTDAGKETHFS